MISAEVVGMISLVVSVLSAIVSVIFSVRAARDTRLQQRGQWIELKQSYYARLQEWADKVIEILTEAIFLCDFNPGNLPDGEYSKMRNITSQKLSALIDQGRFFLPNEKPDIHGTDKPSAYRGFRPPILDDLVRAYNSLRQLSLDQMEANHEVQNQLWNLRKNFVSQVQDILDPRTREAEFKEFLGELDH